MASALARNGGERRALLSAIRAKIKENKRTVLRPAEAVMMLEWAVEAEDPSCRAELLEIFSAAGGLVLVRRALLPED